MTFLLTSPAFADGDPIPSEYTSDGRDISPPLSWSGLPEGTKELVVICDDPDAPTEEPWVHWVIYNIPAGLGSLPEGIPREARVQDIPGVLQGKNSWKIGQTIGYRGPAPPSGSGLHHYHFTAYAIPAKLIAEPGMDKDVVLQGIDAQVMAETELVGTYER